MELTNEFTVGVPIHDAWVILTDVERIAPCLPGAQLQEVEGDEYRGVVKVKVGPISAQYKGAATFLEQDAPMRAVLKAEGRDVRGQGNASATITATLEPEGTDTRVRVVTDLTVTGKVAQFGRGVLADVSAKLMGQFVECLESEVLAGSRDESGASAAGNGAGDGAGDVPRDTGGNGASAPAEAASGAAPTTATEARAPGRALEASTAAPGVRRIEHREAAPVDLVGTAGVPVIKRVLPVVGLLLTVIWLLRRRRR